VFELILSYSAFSTLQLPPASAGGINLMVLLALAKITYFLAKANSVLIPYFSS
jgi:hypothetical protein